MIIMQREYIIFFFINLTFVDFGVDKLVELANETNFPWLITNVIDNETDKPLAEGRETFMIEWDGIKVRDISHTV